jgi:hypothetical protein
VESPVTPPPVSEAVTLFSHQPSVLLRTAEIPYIAKRFMEVSRQGIVSRAMFAAVVLSVRNLYKSVQMSEISNLFHRQFLIPGFITVGRRVTTLHSGRPTYKQLFTTEKIIGVLVNKITHPKWTDVRN